MKYALNAIRWTLSAVLFLSAIRSPLSAGFAEEPSAFSQAVAAYNDRDLDAALRHAQEAVRENPEHVDACALLGELYYLRQDMKKARQSWERAAELAPSRQDVQQALRKLQAEYPLEKDLDRSDTHPFVVRFSAGQMPMDSGDLRRMLRDAHRQIGQPFGYFPDHPITVLLYPEADFEQVRGVSHRVVGLYDGKIRLPLKRGPGGEQELKRVLWHEYTHALVHDLAKGRCPLWLNEGIATLQESRVQPVDVRLAREAFRQGTLPAWDPLWQASYEQTGDLALYYQASFLIAQYWVKRWGWRDLVKLLQRLGQGVPISEAISAQYRTDPAALEKEWRSWVRRQG